VFYRDRRDEVTLEEFWERLEKDSFRPRDDAFSSYVKMRLNRASRTGKMSTVLTQMLAKRIERPEAYSFRLMPSLPVLIQLVAEKRDPFLKHIVQELFISTPDGRAGLRRLQPNG
jgi:hypothetical protein